MAYSKQTGWRGDERLAEERAEQRPAGGHLEEVAAAAARESAWTGEADEAFKAKFKEANAKHEYGWGASDLVAWSAETVISTVEVRWLYDVDFILTMMDFVLNMMDFVFKMMDVMRSRR